ncbi:MAG: recombinase family protein [Peptostreptococcaceae bacterium]
MNKVFNYIRVSSKEQNEQRQVEAMKEFNKANDIVNAIELIDKATGTNTDRPNLQMLLKVVGEGDLVVIKSIDRLSRNYKEVMELWNTITNKGADIVVIDMSMLDTRQHKDLLGDFISNLILQVLSYVAQQETEFRSKRQLEGIEAMPTVNGKKVSTKTGRATGRPQAEYPRNWNEQYTLWKQGQQTAKVTMDQLGLKRTTFYKLVSQYEGN